MTIEAAEAGIMTIADDLSRKIHEVESGLLGLGQKIPEINQAMEGTASLIVGLHWYIREQDERIAKMKHALETVAGQTIKLMRMSRP